MSITVTTPGVGPGSYSGFIVNAVSADASGCEELKEAPGAGKSILVHKLRISSSSAITVTIGEGETTPGSPDTNLIGPIPFAANQSIPWEFYPPMKLTANKSLVVDASGAGNINIFVEGEIK